MTTDGIRVWIPEGIVATAGSMDLEGVERLVAEVGPFHEEQSLRNFAEPESGSLEAGFFP